jgi:hypothetical protein
MGGYNCGLKVVRGQPKWAWTCPCGLGYWDGIKEEFINGDRVRRGEALTRADYEAHLRECSRCHAQARKDSLTLVYSKEKGRETQPRTSVQPSTRISATQHQYFLPMEGIHPEVIQSVTEKYLGPEASVKLASSQVGIQVINDHRQGTLLIHFSLTGR